MVTVVFRSRLRAGCGEEFQALAAEMLELAQGMPGFVSYTVFIAADEQRCSVIEFETPEELAAWRDHPRHREAQRLGRERFYESYSLFVGETRRESHFDRTSAPLTGKSN